MAEHTPGPWVMRRRDGALSGDSTNLGWDWDEDHNSPPEPMRGVCTKEADARLIAGAPDLLAALLDIMECPFIVTAMEPHIADRARAAIAKARGQL